MIYQTPMPKIDLDTLQDLLSPQDFELVKGIVNTRTGKLRASKPTLPKKVRIIDSTSPYGYHFDYKDEADANKGKTAYIWRMVAFFVSPISQHQCMPCTETSYLPSLDSWDNRRALEKYLDGVVNEIVNTIPPQQHAGVIRWGKALGYL